MADRTHTAKGVLVVRDASGRVLSVGSGDWARWLEQSGNTAFRVVCGAIGFTARRELKRGHPYWYAYRRRGGRLHKVYLGRAIDLTAERLVAASLRLDYPVEGPPASADDARTTRKPELTPIADDGTTVA